MSDQSRLCIDSLPRPDRPHCSIIKEQDGCRIGNEFGLPMILGRVVVVAVTKTSGGRVGFLAACNSLANAERRTYTSIMFCLNYMANYAKVATTFNFAICYFLKRIELIIYAIETLTYL